MKLCEQMLNPLQLNPSFSLYQKPKKPDFKSMKAPRLMMSGPSTIIANDHFILDIEYGGTAFYVAGIKVPRHVIANNSLIEFVKSKWPEVCQYVYKTYGAYVLSSL